MSDTKLSDADLAELMDQYVARLEAGDLSGCRAVVAEHPEIEEYVNCLEALDALSRPDSPAPVASAAFGSDASSQQTVQWRPTPTPPGDSSDAATAPHDEAFGRYVLLGEAGRGGMGVVYRARQTDLDRVVAIKMILSSRLASRDDVRRFYVEARAAGRLRHANIVAIHEVGELHGQHYFTMDFVDGKSLAELLRQGPLPIEIAVRLLCTIARAVEYLHRHEIIHRDLKPSNILVDESGVPYLTDFGLAKVFRDDGYTRTGEILGTPSYMAPEQARGDGRESDGRCDVYGMGAILYEMLTGRPPFREESQVSTILQVLEREPALPRRINGDVPRKLEQICMRCLEKDPQDRYASAAELADDLERFLRDEALEARPMGPLRLVRRWARQQPALVSHLAGITAAAGIMQVRYLTSEVPLDYHLKITGIFALWAVLCGVLQLLLDRPATTETARYLWAAADASLLTATLCLAGPPLGPLLIGYPVLIAGSGLWFRVRLVVFTTTACLISYLSLTLLRPEPMPPHYPLIFAAVLAVLGLIIGIQVHRLRALTRYFEGQPHV